MSLRQDLRLPVAALFALAALGCAPREELRDTPSPAERASERLPLELCRRDDAGEDLLCGTLRVPENRNLEGGREITLSVVVVPALSDTPALEPWFDFEGGPGDSATELASMYVHEVPYYRRSRDVVLMDARGTGESDRLFCAELDEPEQPLLPRFDLASVVTCRDRLSATRDLTRYSTTEIVRDADRVREWLGYERMNVFGFSYGTLAAVTYARRYPERVASLALWGPVPPTFQRPRYYARDGQLALEGLFRACDEDPACAESFPDLRRALDDVLARLEEDPAPTSWRRGDEEVPVQIDRATFGESLWSALFHRAGAVPRVIAAAAEGDFDPFVELANVDGRLNVRDATEAMYLSVTCAEETLQLELGDRDPADAARLLGEDRLMRQVAACEAWPRRTVPPDFHEPLKSSVPTLLVVGELDPVTPPPWAQWFRDSLPNSRLLVVPEMGHSAAGMVNENCIDQLIATFGDDLDPQGLDVSCLATMKRGPFASAE